MKLQISPAAKKAILIGGSCSCSYLAVYVARNILGAVSPKMVESGVLTTEQVGVLSSVYFVSYAIGQLINGSIGDKIKAKYMISIGLVLAGVGNLMFSLLYQSVAALYVVYGISGFFLSMIYGPMTKVVAENTEPIYTTRCSLGYTFASFLGSPLAGILAAFLVWKGVFAVSSAVLLVMGSVTFTIFTLFEKRGIIEYNKYRREKNSGGGWKILLRHHIVKFVLISIITGVVRTTVVFWMPTYISQYLGFDTQKAALLFTVSTFFLSMTTFIAVFVYERLGRDMNKTILVAFISATCGFTMVYFLKMPAVNLMQLVFSIVSSNSAATMMWSRYCPSLRDTGMVSGVTGFLDFVSYVAAAVASTLFANAVSTIGWSNLILIWLGLMILGVIVALPYHKWIKA